MSNIDYTALINDNGGFDEETPSVMTMRAAPIAESWSPMSGHDTYTSNGRQLFDEDVSEVNKKKVIDLDKNQVNLTQEKFSQFIPFTMDRYQDGIDFSNAAISINYTRPGETNVIKVPAVNAEYSTSKIRFGWLVDDYVTEKEGALKFGIEITGSIMVTNKNGNTSYQAYTWKSQTNEDLKIIKSLGTGSEITLDEGWQDKVIASVAAAVSTEFTKHNYYNKSEVDNLIETEIGERVEPFLTTYVTDGSLSVDNSEYKVTLTLTTAGRDITSTIDLPLESVVVDGKYREVTEGEEGEIGKFIDLTLHNDKVITIPVDGIISGLATTEQLDAAKTELQAAIAAAIQNATTLIEAETGARESAIAVVEAKFGDLGSHTEGEGDEAITVENTVKYYVDTAVASKDLSAYYTKEETYSKSEVDTAIKNVNVTSQLNELKEEFNAKLNIGDAESVAKYVEDYVKDKIGDIDLEEQLKSYVTEVELREEIGELVGEDGSTKLSVKEYIEEQLNTNASSNYYKATYGKTEIEGVEQDNIFTLWKADEDFDPEQPGEIQVTAVSQFQITGGGGSGATLNKLYLYREADKKGNPIKKYTYRVEDVESSKAILKYSFNGIQAANNQPVDDVTGVWEYRRGTTGDWKTISTFSLEITPEDTLAEFNASQYLKENDTYQFKLKASDDSGASTSLTWTVTRIYFAIDLDFDDNKGYPIKDTYLNYTPWGVGIEKTIHFKFSNLKEITSTTLFSGESTPWLIPISEITQQLRHGAHLLDVWMTAEINGVEISSEHQYKDIIFYDPNRTVPIVGIAPQTYNVSQYSSLNIEFTVYDPNTTKPIVYIQEELEGGVLGEIQERTPEGVTDFYTFKADTPTSESGVHKIHFTVYDPTKEFFNTRTVGIKVDKFPYEISPVVGAVIDFNPMGRNNAEVTLNKDGTAIAWTDGTHILSTSANFDWTNGGYQSDYDDNGRPISGTEHFLIKAGTSAELSYKFFGGDGDGEDPANNGRDFKLVFKTQRVEKANARFVSCLSESNGQKIGLEMNVHEAYIHGGTKSLYLPYSEGDVIEFGFKIPSNSSKVKAVTGYEDGVSTSVMLNDGLAFVQEANDRKNIILGSDDCDVLVYRLKIYENELSDKQILTNFIADARTGEEMKNRYERNQIYDSTGKLTPKYLAEKCPWLRVITITAPTFTTGKEKADAVLGSTIEYRYNGAAEDELSYWRCVDAVHVGQGTSSNKYGASGRNIDLVLKEYKSMGNNPIIYLNEPADGEAVNAPGDEPIIVESGKVALSRTSIPNNYFNVKVNIASSENANNALLAKRFNEYAIFKRPFADDQCVTVDGKRITPKETMEFFNCVVFIAETADSGHTEFNDKNYHFYAIGNIGDSKKTDKTRLTNKTDDYECCLEIMNVKLPLSDFPVDTIVNAMTTDEDGNYLFATDENLQAGLLLIKDEATGQYIKASGDKVDVINTVYYIDGRAAEDFSEKFTYGWRYIKEYDPEDFKTDENTDEQAKAAADAKNKEIADYCANKWWELYDFVTTSTDKEFYENLENYFVLDSALYYYLFTTRYTMVDNRAKNSFWHYGKVGEDAEGNPIRKWDLNWGYDMDTALGTDNDGDMVYRYGYEDIDVDEKGVEIFRESDSTFFCRLRDLFKKELAERYTTNHKAWNAQDLIDKFDNWQAQFPEELWRLDIQRKYIRPASGPVDGSIDKGTDNKYLDNMANGKKKYQRRQFERNQELYMASKYRAPAASSDDNQIVLRCANVENDDSTLVVPQSFNITLTPYTYMYLNVEQDSGAKKNIRVTELFDENGKNKTYDFKFNSAADFVYIDSAHWIQSLGDISAMYPSTVSVPGAKKLKELIIGNDSVKNFDDGSSISYYNQHLSTLTPGANELLEVLNIENVGYAQTLDLSKLVNLREVYAKGSAITGITCANGGELQTAELPAIGSITMNNLIELSDLILERYDNLRVLNVSNCPGVDWVDIINKSEGLTRLRLTGINWELSNRAESEIPATALLERIYNMSDWNGTGKSVLEGYIKLDKIDLKDYEKFTERWKGLTIDATTKVPYYVVTFKNEEAGETYLTQNVTQGEQVVKPDFIPVKTSTPEYDYVFRYWRLEGKTGEYSYSNPVTGPLTLVPYFEKIVRKYTVQYVDHNNNILQETKNVDYGAYISYSGEVPVNTIQEPIGIYQLFKGWDQSGYVHPTSVETATIVIKPVFEEFNWTTVDVDNLNLKELSNNAAAIYALTKQISEVEGMRDKVSSQFSDYTTDDVITLQMGEDFATWSDVTIYDYLTNGIGKIYDGTDGARSTESLFKEDKDFTFVLDYTLKNTINEMGKNNIYTICSNYTNNLGFKLYCDGSGKQKLDYSVKKDGVTEQRTITLATAAMKYNSNKQPDNFLREVLVFAHKKGTSTIECYFSNKQPATGEVPEVFYQQLDFGEFPNIAIDLAFGGEISGLLYNNKATGVLHWVKKFDAYLDEVECNKLAAWTRETVQFFPCFNSSKEPLNLSISGGQSGETTSLVFMSTHLLDMLGSIYGDSTSLWGDEGSRSRLYLNNRWFNGVSPLWRQLIKPVLVTSQRSDSAQSTESKVFIPAIRNLASTTGYANEGETISLFADLDNNRKAYFADGTGPAPYWTRSRQSSSGHNTYYINESGSVVYTNDPEYLNAYYRIMIGM